MWLSGNGSSKFLTSAVSQALYTSNQSVGTLVGSVSTPASEDVLPQYQAKSDEPSNYSDDGCSHIPPIEAIERRCIGLFFFCLCTWLFYGAAIRALEARRYWRTGECWILGLAYFWLIIEFAAAPPTFGCSRWNVFGGTSCAPIWRKTAQNKEATIKTRFIAHKL